jgi:hypothetical protein
MTNINLPLAAIICLLTWRPCPQSVCEGSNLDRHSSLLLTHLSELSIHCGALKQSHYLCYVSNLSTSQ